MNLFVHRMLGHFYQEEVDGEGNDLGGGGENEEEQEEEHEEEELEPDEVIVTLGDEPPESEEEQQQAQAPQWVRDLRKDHRELQRKNRELEQKLKTVASPEVAAVPALGPKPKLEDLDYDTDKYDAALDAWYTQKRKVDDAAAKLEADKTAQQQQWNQTLNNYGEAKSKLKVRDFEDAESAVDEILSETQRGIILHATANPAQMIYALGKNPAKARELAAIKDPVKYACAIGALETKLKVQPRKAPPPETGTVRGSGSISGAVDSTLDRLRAEAEKTGDLSKVVAYKRSKKQSG